MKTAANNYDSVQAEERGPDLNDGMFQGTTSLDIREGISMTEPFTIQFNDLDTLQEALVIVRYDDRCVVVALSHKETGDLQVVMNKDDARRFLEALNAAVK